MSDELAGKKIVLVDDDRDILQAMETALSELGAEIRAAADGDEAVMLSQEFDPDLVVLDMMLPKRSGFLVMESLRRDKNPDEPPLVIMITGNLGRRHKIYAESLGIKEYLNKPFRMEKLVGVIRDLLT